MPQASTQHHHDQSLNRSQRRLLSLAISAALAGGLSAGVHAQVFPPVVQLSSLDGTNGFKLDGESASDYSGSSVSAAGDINGDGIDDLIVGARGADPNGSDSGRSYVVFGTTNGFSSPLTLSSLDGTNGFKLDGEATGDRSGRSVSAAGDINGDGIDDLIVGARGADPNGSDSGRSYVVFGTTNGFSSPLTLSSLDGTNGFKLDGEATGDRSGRSVSAAGDINGDGIDDLIIGAAGADANGNESGRSYVVFGTTTGFGSPLPLSSLNGTNGFMLDGVVGDGSGYSVSAAGDINGDGVDDLIVGAPLADPNGNGNSGRSYVVFGKTTGFDSPLTLSSVDGTNGFMLEGVAAYDLIGRMVSGAGDINGDGIDDLIVGARGADPNGSDSGRSYVVFGTTNGFSSPLALSSLDGTNGFMLDGEEEYDRSGTSVSAAGDINGDGIDDLIIGAPTVNTNGSQSGRSYVVFGKTTGFGSPLPLSSLDGRNGFMLDGEATGDQSGSSVSAAGDINGDGFDDLIIGAPLADPNGMISGRSYLLFGRVTGTPVVDFGGMKLLDFGNVFVGTSESAKTLTLSNPGTGLVLIDDIAIAETSFAITGGSCGEPPIRIRIDASCTLDVRFTPQAEGFVQSQMIFTSNSVTSPDSIILQGIGLPTPTVSLLPDPLAFGDVAIGDMVFQMLMVENTGGGTLEPGMVSIQGSNAGDFMIATNNCVGVQLANGESCGIDVGFSPGAPGIRRGTLQLDTNAPSSPDFLPLRGSNNLVFADGFE